MNAQTLKADVKDQGSAVVKVGSGAGKSGKGKDVAPSSLRDMWRALESGTGEVPSALVEIAFGFALGEVEASSPQVIAAAETKVSDATAALVAARAEHRTAVVKAGEAKVNLSRLLVILTTKDVRGVRTLTAKDAAERLGVSQAHISQVVANGRAIRRLPGQPWSRDTYAVIDAARRKGADALTATVARAADVAETRVKAETTETSEKGKAVRVSTDDIRKAAVMVGAAQAEVKAPVVLDDVIGFLDRMTKRIADGAKVEGAKPDVERLRESFETFVGATALV